MEKRERERTTEVPVKWCDCFTFACCIAILCSDVQFQDKLYLQSTFVNTCTAGKTEARCHEGYISVMIRFKVQLQKKNVLAVFGLSV